MAKVVPDQRARQGGQGRPVVMVLAGSLVLLGIALVALMGWFGSTTPQNPSQAAAQQAAGPSASSSNATARGVPAENPAYPSPAEPKSGGPGAATTTR